MLQKSRAMFILTNIFRLGLAVMFLWTCPVARAAETRPTLLRATILVKDAGASIAFYSLLGFRIESDVTNSRTPNANAFPLNAPSMQSRLVIMQSAHGKGGKIGLLEFSDPTPPSVRGDGELVGRGDVVFVFDVADAESTHNRLLASHAKVLEPPQTFVSRQKSSTGKSLTGKVFHVRDPDGYLVELLQAAKP